MLNKEDERMNWLCSGTEKSGAGDVKRLLKHIKILFTWDQKVSVKNLNMIRRWLSKTFNGHVVSESVLRKDL